MFNLLVTQLAFTALLDQGLKAGKNSTYLAWFMALMTEA